ncbi:PREDICTED: dual specificity protein kinase shkE-like [Amphimedon queenslandica]|uniref:Protein kinase domain-containing protein n=2 Tax=Amphimedon queenslandica TaxID=400682 RepID=A0AAN0IRE6_AMPQE|nr:PREDICTED: dual specificity protein kinase shkE-like [Amphimedon queenslandica]|eukprot:XP_011407113.1 PREDICTED: dual specificity protein kinase shkE-like [Amphimedon queenslandica]
MRRGSGGIISFEHDGVYHLLMIGGYGPKPAVQLPHYKYIELSSGNWRTNEHSIYSLSSRKWNNPLIIGQYITPANDFIIEKINNTRAVLFGGVETDDDDKTTVTNNVYILEISVSTVFWQCIKEAKAIDQWPVGRYGHAGAIIITGSDCPMLVISGGADKNNDTLDDYWIFNITQHSWIKLDVPHSVSKRFGHSLSVFIMSPHCVWMITAGGYFVANPKTVMLTELVTNSKGEWTVGDILDTIGMNNEEYKKKYQQQLQIVRRIWLEEYQKPRKGDTADIEQTIQAFMKSLEEKEKEAQVYRQQLEHKEREEAEKEQEIRRYCHQLQEKDREYQVALQENQEALRQKNREVQEKNWELQEKDRELQEKHKELQEKDRELQENEEKLQQQDIVILEKDRDHQVVLQENQEALWQKDREVQEKNWELHEKDRELQEKHKELQEKDTELQENEEKLRQQDIVILEKDRDHQVVLQENQEALWQKDREVQEKNWELHEKDRELQEKDRELQEKDRELRQSQEVVRRYQQQALTDDHWVINKDEVTLTKEELGRGSYAVVKVGIFRGLRVAVKSLHTIIISDFNLALFSREMSIASRVRHPNLVQFIGATKVGNPLILTELMSTSLNQELRRNRLTNQQILSIAQDVALGLNYLHLFKPQPIIHRDVSSPNVLLKPCTGPAGYEAKVADYGTAKLVQVDSTGTIMPGNVAYAAPEAPIPDQHSPAMDVYSYSVLLMEMNLYSPPEMTTAEREVQSGSVSWSDMKSLIQRGLNASPRARPTMAQVIESLKKMKI